MFTKRTGLMLLGSVLGSELVWIVFQKVRTMCASSSATQVIFLPDDSVTTFPPGRGQEVSSSSGVGRLVAALREVRHSLDLAVFLITCRQLADEVVLCHKRGVAVRLITEHTNTGVAGCQVTRLRDSGVAVLSKQQPGLMHHKFAILDSSRLVNGSFNWTGRAVFSNSENLVISADLALVAAFQGEFDRLWCRAAGDGAQIGGK